MDILAGTAGKRLADKTERPGLGRMIKRDFGTFKLAGPFHGRAQDGDVVVRFGKVFDGLYCHKGLGGERFTLRNLNREDGAENCKYGKEQSHS